MQSDNDDYVQSIEEEFLQCIDNENDQSEIRFLSEREALVRNVWSLFQDSATAVAQLYRGKCSLSCSKRRKTQGHLVDMLVQYSTQTETPIRNKEFKEFNFEYENVFLRLHFLEILDERLC
jgi:hypothetical protein